MPRVPKSGEAIVDENQFYRLKKDIREYIRTLPDGDSVQLSEKAIAEKFRLTQGASRKLLLRLEAEGVVKSVPGIGYRKVDYSGTTVRTHFHVRRSLEGEAARLAATRADSADLLRLELILDEMEREITPDYSDRFFVLDREFHMAVVEASHDNLLKNLYSMLDFSIPAWLGQGFEIEYGMHNRNAFLTHQDIFRSIRDGNPEAAMMTMQHHLALPFNNNIAISESRGPAGNIRPQGSADGRKQETNIPSARGRREK